MKTCDKLPEIITLAGYNGNWEDFLESIYNAFKNDFINGNIRFFGKQVGIFTQKLYRNKERSFWHIISEGKDDMNRLPDLRRCERVTWVKELIELIVCRKYGNIKVRKKLHKKRYRFYVWCSETDYIVILEDRKKYMQLITAFIVKYDDARDSYKKDYIKYKLTV